MMYNLFTPQSGALPYPHYTKMDNNEAHIVTHPDTLMDAGDSIRFSDSLATRDSVYIVSEVLERRPAKGDHAVDFIPVFQKLKVELI